VSKAVATISVSPSYARLHADPAYCCRLDTGDVASVVVVLPLPRQLLHISLLGAHGLRATILRLYPWFRKCDNRTCFLLIEFSSSQTWWVRDQKQEYLSHFYAYLPIHP
jgi:hypothetical protein